MKILAPFDSVDEVKPLIKAGASELYCGLNVAYWREKSIFSNARHMSYGNLSSFRELGDSVAIASDQGIPIFLCANDYLAHGAFEYLIKDISSAINIGVQGVIITDVSLIPFIQKESSECKIILSCLNPCFSSLGLEFYKDLGVKRIVLPLNQMTLTEIIDVSLVAKRLSIELEVFINNVACKNIPGFCLYQDFMNVLLYRRNYRYGMRFALSVLQLMSKPIPPKLKDRLGRRMFTSMHPFPCRQECRLEKFKNTDKGSVKVETIRSFLIDRNFAKDYCGLCSLYILDKYGIVSGKIAGRGYPLRRKNRDVLFARKYLDGIRKGYIGEDNFVKMGRAIYRDVYGRDCLNKRCHYAEVNKARQTQGRE